jgi:hypothetical protein
MGRLIKVLWGLWLILCFLALSMAHLYGVKAMAHYLFPAAACFLVLVIVALAIAVARFMAECRERRGRKAA